uniref:Uncharacterized protein n=1 Tax=Sphaerodactylus townsendi TaxID=933632 RepID=A0ACB8EPR8_9SAUR
MLNLLHVHYCTFAPPVPSPHRAMVIHVQPSCEMRGREAQDRERSKRERKAEEAGTTLLCSQVEWPAKEWKAMGELRQQERSAIKLICTSEEAISAAGSFGGKDLCATRKQILELDVGNCSMAVGETEGRASYLTLIKKRKNLG